MATFEIVMLLLLMLDRVLGNKCDFQIEPGDRDKILQEEVVFKFDDPEWHQASINNGYIVKPLQPNKTNVKIEEYYVSKFGETILELEIRIISDGCHLEYYDETKMRGEIIMRSDNKDIIFPIYGFNDESDDIFVKLRLLNEKSKADREQVVRINMERVNKAQCIYMVGRYSTIIFYEENPFQISKKDWEFLKLGCDLSGPKLVDHKDADCEIRQNTRECSIADADTNATRGQSSGTVLIIVIGVFVAILVVCAALYFTRNDTRRISVDSILNKMRNPSPPPISPHQCPIDQISPPPHCCQPGQTKSDMSCDMYMPTDHERTRRANTRISTVEMERRRVNLLRTESWDEG